MWWSFWSIFSQISDMEVFFKELPTKDFNWVTLMGGGASTIALIFSGLEFSPSLEIICPKNNTLVLLNQWHFFPVYFDRTPQTCLRLPSVFKSIVQCYSPLLLSQIQILSSHLWDVIVKISLNWASDVCVPSHMRVAQK